MNIGMVKEMGVLAADAYNDRKSKTTYTLNNIKYEVLATQSDLLGSIYTDLFGFQAMLVEELDVNIKGQVIYRRNHCFGDFDLVDFYYEVILWDE